MLFRSYYHSSLSVERFTQRHRAKPSFWKRHGASRPVSRSHRTACAVPLQAHSTPREASSQPLDSAEFNLLGSDDRDISDLSRQRSRGFAVSDKDQLQLTAGFENFTRELLASRTTPTRTAACARNWRRFRPAERNTIAAVEHRRTAGSTSPPHWCQSGVPVWWDPHKLPDAAPAPAEIHRPYAPPVHSSECLHETSNWPADDRQCD